MPAIANPCCCTPTCPPIFADDFNRADETIEDTPATDSTGQWKGEGIDDDELWEIRDGALVIEAGPGHAPTTVRPFIRHINTTDYERALLVTLRIWLPAPGAMVRIKLQMDVSETESIGAYAEFKSDEDEASDCGTMRILVDGESGLEQLGRTVPVDGMTEEEWHDVSICIDFDLTHCGISFDEQRHHSREVPTFTGEGIVPGWELRLFADQSIEGLYKFDDVAVTHLQSSGYGYYGYYGYYDDCPTCKGDNLCETITIELPASYGYVYGGQDCRWEDDGNGGGCWKGSWSGLASDGSSDNTTGVALHYTPSGVGSVTLSLGSFTATVTITFEEYTGYAATLTLSTSESEETTIILDAENVLGICCIADVVLVSANDTIIAIEPLPEDSGISCDGEICASRDGSVELNRIEIKHNLPEQECLTCVPDGDIIENDCTDPDITECADGKFPKHAFFRAVPTSDNCSGQCAGWFAGTFIGFLVEVEAAFDSCQGDWSTDLFCFQDGDLETTTCPCTDLVNHGITTLPQATQVCFQMGAEIRTSLSGFYLVGFIRATTPSEGEGAVCGSWQFESGTIAPLGEPPICPGLSAVLDFVSFSGDPDVVNCGFSDSTLEIVLSA